MKQILKIFREDQNKLGNKETIPERSQMTFDCQFYGMADRELDKVCKFFESRLEESRKMYQDLTKKLETYLSNRGKKRTKTKSETYGTFVSSLEFVFTLPGFIVINRLFRARMRKS